MPYTIEQNNELLYCVYLAGDDGAPTGDSLGCHETHEQAAAQIGAIEANEKGGRLRDDQVDLYERTYAEVLTETGDKAKAELAAWGACHRQDLLKVEIKSIDADGITIGGWGMLFTGPDELDLTGTYFSQETQTLLDFYPEAPLFLEHDGMINRIAGPIGKRTKTEVFPRGIWAEHQLFSSHALYDAVIDDIKAGLYSYSSDSMGHYVDPGYQDDGHLSVWPIAAWSITKTPAEPGLGPVTLVTYLELVKSAAARGRDALTRDSVDTLATNEVNVIDIRDRSHNLMDKFSEVVKGLTSFLKMDESAVVEEVAAELESLLEVVQELVENGNGETASRMEDEDDETATRALDLEQLRLAVGVGADASDDELVAALESILATLRGGDSEGEAMASRSYDYSGLATAAKAARKLAPAVTPKIAPHSSATVKSERRQSLGAPRLVSKDNMPLWNAIRSRHPNYSHEYAGKTASSLTGPQGGGLLNEDISSDVIPALRSKLFFSDFGVSIESMSGLASRTFPKNRREPTAYWVGEATTIPESDSLIDQVTLTPKPLACRVIIPNHYLDNVTINYEQWIREQIAFQIAKELERAALFGVGAVTAGNTGAQPLGIVNVPGVTSTAISAAPAYAHLTAAITRMQTNDMDIEASPNAGWVFSPRTSGTLQNITDTTGQPLLRPKWSEFAANTLMGINYKTSTNIPNTAGGGSDSYIILGDWKHLRVGISGSVEYMVNPYRLAHQMMTEVIAWMYADSVVEYEEAFEVLTGVQA